MQLAMLRVDGSPAVCNVWYDAHFAPDLLRFISRHDRSHSANIRNDTRVAGSIVAVQREALGQLVRGVMFTGTARELGTAGIDAEIEARRFLAVCGPQNGHLRLQHPDPRVPASGQPSASPQALQSPHKTALG
jgi:hypothetical protein